MKIEDIPNFTFSKKMLDTVFEIERLTEMCESIHGKKKDIRLRRKAAVRSIDSSVAIEGNSLGLLKVKDMMNGKTVEGPFDEIVEVRNAIHAYGMMDEADPYSIDDLLKVEDSMMAGLVSANGFRDCGVGVFEGDRQIYKAPEPDQVAPMMAKLFEWQKNSDWTPLVKGAVVHYYIEAIHPFRDGNGRMGRYWHTLILRRMSEVFGLVSIESNIRMHQEEYYQVIEKCQHSDPQDCSGFIEFCLNITKESLEGLIHLEDENMKRLLKAMGGNAMSTSEIMERMELKNRQNFQALYLRPAIGYGFVDPIYDNPRHKGQKYRKTIL